MAGKSSRIAQRFNAGLPTKRNGKSRKGRKNSSAVPAGLTARENAKPSIEVLGYSRMGEAHLALGLDFGTESVRALLVDLRGREQASAVAHYRHGQIIDSLPGSHEKLPPHYALQHPQDWMESAAKATRAALRTAKAKSANVLGIGVDFTSCTMLPALRDGTPLCLVKRFAREPLAWPKLWKHHGAQAQTDRINQVARERGEKLLD